MQASCSSRTTGRQGVQAGTTPQVAGSQARPLPPPPPHLAAAELRVALGVAAVLLVAAAAVVVVGQHLGALLGLKRRLLRLLLALLLALRSWRGTAPLLRPLTLHAVLCGRRWGFEGCWSQDAQCSTRMWRSWALGTVCTRYQDGSELPDCSQRRHRLPAGGEAHSMQVSDTSLQKRARHHLIGTH